MEYTMCTQSVKRKEFLVQLVYKKDRFSIGNFDLFGYHTLILFSKIQKFYRDKELSKSNQTRYGVYHVYLERKTKRFFGAACLEKSSYFNRKYRLIRLLYAYSIFRKIQKFYRVKELSKSNQTRYGVSHVYLERKTKRIFGIAYLQKSSFFNRKFRLLRLFYFQKYRNFIGTRNCPNRTKLAMEYTMCTQSVKRKEFSVQLLYKKRSFFNRKFRLLRLFYFQKYRNFIGTRNCPNRTKLAMEYTMCTQSVKPKDFLVQLVQKKVHISIGNIDLFAYYTLILFSEKYRNFIGSRSCPNRTKLAMEYTMCTQSVKRKEFSVQLLYKKDRFSIGNFDFFGYSIFKNIEILSGQGIVQIEPNSLWSIPCVPRA